MSSLPLATQLPDNVVRLSGRTLTLARALWLLICGSAACIFVIALPFRYQLLLHPSPTNLVNLNALGISTEFFAAYSLFWEIVIAVPYIVIGFIIFWRCGEERIALFTSLVLVVFGIGSGTITPTIRALLGMHPALDMLQHIYEFLAWLGFGLLFYIFPNGRFVPKWTRGLAVVWLFTCIAWNLFPHTVFDPTTWSPFLLIPFIGTFWLSWLFCQIYRYRRVSTAVERQQTKWIVFAIALIILAMLITSVIGWFVPGYDVLSQEQPTPQAFAFMFWQLVLNPVMLALPVALAFSIMRYRLWDIDNLISRALVYGTLTAFVIAIYALIVGGLGALLEMQGNLLLALVATGIIAVLFEPLRARLQQFVNRLLYGERDNPYAVLARLGKNLENALAPDAVLSTIVETIAQTLKLPYAAILLQDKNALSVAAAYGTPVSRALALPLMYQHQFVGELHVAPRAANEPFNANERRLLQDIAAQIGAAVHTVRLTADLKRSREQIVTAREEERRRLRRDLHDGLGPKLAGQTLKLEAALGTLDDDTETTRALLEETMSESQNIIAEIRRLVYGLRPPALDQFGLNTAIREQAAQYRRSGLQINLDLPDTLPTLPAAVEVAAYGIAQEALTNMAKHARAKTCTVTLILENALRLQICDDGVGLAPDLRAGVGMSSMRERAEEIGGTCVIEAGAQGGTCVTATLPIARSTGVPANG